ncbi:MAG: sulfur oxidation c-type cytochrome SoxX [Epsilonproteobacteria bacterium]|nr:sulfur oxidation c-type cytochrome SoxX [Campylobacterota bacterium]
MKKFFLAAVVVAVAATASMANEDLVKKGRKIFMTKKLGNCLACHDVNGDKVDGPGSLGPKLQFLSAWPEQALYDKIYDPYTTNPLSAMPPFGKNGVLSDEEIKAVVAYLKTIN